MQRIDFVVDGIAPSVNHAYYFIRKGKRTVKVKTTQAKKWVEQVRHALMREILEIDDRVAISKVENKLPLFEGDVIVHLRFFYKDNRKHDIDNYQKLTIDALTDLVWADDNQIVELHSIKEKAEFCQTHITITDREKQMRLI